jgi:hypothetical protein
MSDSKNPAVWLHYARENLQVAEMLLGGNLWNACLQNASKPSKKP